jgi:hypothetical protein
MIANDSPRMETLTNNQIMSQGMPGESLYIEQWFSYRDIFGHAYVLGEIGRYYVSNDSFLPEMLYPVHLGTNR